MSAKLIISLEGKQVDVFTIDKDVSTIGRDASNDISIDGAAISGFHCKIITILNDSFLEDLKSTNGTAINGKEISKYPLSDGDEIQIGLHTLVYRNPKQADQGTDFNSTMIIRPDAAAGLSERSTMDEDVNKENLAKVSSGTVVPTDDKISFLKILSGNNAGKKLKLTKALTTIGKTGAQTAAITNRSDGYYIILVSGGSSSDEDKPKLNNAALSKQAIKLNKGDIIAVAGIRLEFSSN